LTCREFRSEVTRSPRWPARNCPPTSTEVSADLTGGGRTPGPWCPQTRWEIRCE